MSYTSSFFHTLSAESTSLLLLGWCYLALGACFLRNGRMGLLCYSIIAIIVSDIQVLCAAQFTYYDHPLVLGTIVYSSLFLVNDLIVEKYGLQAAKESITLTMTAHIMLIIFISFTLGYLPLSSGEDHESYIMARQAIEILFKPHSAIFLASQIAFYVSQWCDIHIFSAIRRHMPAHIAIRGFVAIFLGIIIDTLLFNILAWEVFSSDPVPWNRLWSDYICANTVIQFCILFINIPVFYVLLRLSSITPYRLWPSFSFRIPENWLPSRTRWKNTYSSRSH